MLYTFGSTEKPKEMAHTTAKVIMWTSLTVKTVFNRCVVLPQLRRGHWLDR